MQKDHGSPNSRTEGKSFDNTVDKVQAFTSLCIMQSHIKKEYLEVHKDSNFPPPLHSAFQAI
jgi:hypothetical protein